MPLYPAQVEILYGKLTALELGEAASLLGHDHAF
jgi:hypothetical protein